MTVDDPVEGQAADLDVAIALGQVQEQMREFRAEMVARQLNAMEIVRVSAEETR